MTPFERDRVAIELGLTPPPPGYRHPRWRRNRTGSVVHHNDCPRLGKNSVAWFWAERYKTEEELVKHLPEWVRPCGHCCWQYWRRVFAFFRRVFQSEEMAS